jgi:hypothetical protein
VFRRIQGGIFATRSIAKARLGGQLAGVMRVIEGR